MAVASPLRNGLPQSTTHVVEKKVVIQASVTAESPSEEEVANDAQSQLKSTAKEANRTTEDAIDKLKLSPSEQQQVKSIRNVDSFLEFVTSVERGSVLEKQNSVGAAVQRSVAEFKKFAEAYSELFDAISDAVPFGAGSLCFGFCGVLLTTISRKVEREEAMRKSLSRVTKTLPRLRQYGIVYRESPAVTKALVQLHNKVMEFLCEVFLYCKDRGLKGALIRYKKALAPSDKIASLVDEINVISRDIFHEGMVELSKEVRKITNSVETTKKEMRKKLDETKMELKKANQIIAELDKKLKEASELSIGNDLERIKGLFVDKNYDPGKVFEHAKNQILQSSVTENQKQGYRQALDRHPLRTWLDGGDEMATSKGKPIVWITSKKPDSSAISRMSLMALDQLLERDGQLPSLSRTGSQPLQKCLIIYSPYQKGFTTSTLGDRDGTRTAYTLFQDAIYQLILHHPHVIRENVALKDICRKAQAKSSDQQLSEVINISGLAKLLRDLVQLIIKEFSSATADSTEINNPIKAAEASEYFPAVTVTPVLPPHPSIYWIIDRVDTVQWKRKPPLPNNMVLQLSEFARAIEIAVYGNEQDRPRSNKKTSKNSNGTHSENALKVLITSTSSPYQIDAKWTEVLSDDVPSSRFLRPEWIELSV